MRDAINVAILGAGRIGKIHARLFQSLGANVVAILSSTKDNANRAARELQREYGLSVKPFWNLTDILCSPIDAVSICTPPFLHYDHILASFEQGLAVFCEKPLFWSNDSYNETRKKLNHLKSHRNRKLFMNISNSLFIDKICERAPKPDEVKSFYFQFNTNGKNRKFNILIDLLPHGISLLHRFFGSRSVTNIDYQFSSYNAIIEFYYGICSIKFDFQQKEDYPKKFFFRINNNEYLRIQEDRDDSYHVFIQDINNNDKIELDDPFRIYISEFLEYCSDNPVIKEDKFEEAEINLNLMNNLLHKRL